MRMGDESRPQPSPPSGSPALLPVRTDLLRAGSSSSSSTRSITSPSATAPRLRLRVRPDDERSSSESSTTITSLEAGGRATRGRGGRARGRGAGGAIILPLPLSRVPMAYSRVQARAVSSCSLRRSLYCCAIRATGRGSMIVQAFEETAHREGHLKGCVRNKHVEGGGSIPGFGSVKSDDKDRMTLKRDSAGDLRGR